MTWHRRCAYQYNALLPGSAAGLGVSVRHGALSGTPISRVVTGPDPLPKRFRALLVS